MSKDAVEGECPELLLAGGDKNKEYEVISPCQPFFEMFLQTMHIVEKKSLGPVAPMME